MLERKIAELRDGIPEPSYGGVHSKGESMRTAHASFLLALLAPLAAAQTSWHSYGSGSAPARSRHAMAFDFWSLTAIRFGGIDATGALATTTEWWFPGRSGWYALTLTPGTSPAPREHASIIADGSRGDPNWGGVFVAFGGRDQAGARGDLWELDVRAVAGGVQPVGYRGTWRQPALTGPRPAARWGHSMVFDGLRSRVLVFGGTDGTTDFGDLWQWRGQRWTQLAGGPPPRRFAAMSYDERRDRVVLFGGEAGSSELADTWELAGDTWVQRTPAAPPPAGAGTMGYSQFRDVHVYVNGHGTWEWDGADWIERDGWSQSPRPRRHAPMTWCWLLGEMVLNGGESAWNVLADTWGYRPLHHADFGRCSFESQSTCSPSTRHAIELVDNRRPWIGTTSRLRVLAATGVDGTAIGLLGLSGRCIDWQTSVPIPLGPVGLPGCVLHQSVDAAQALPVRDGVAFWDVAIPADLALAGFRVAVQALVPDPTSTIGMTITDAYALYLGTR